MRFKIFAGLLLLFLVSLLVWDSNRELEASEPMGLEQQPAGLAGAGLMAVEPGPVGEGSESDLAGVRESAHDPRFLPGTTWAEGRLVYPPGFTPAPDTRVWGKGAEWPDRSRWYGAEVDPDGSFHMPFAEGTEVASLYLQDWKCYAAPVPYRVWQNGPIEIEAKEGAHIELQVVGKGVDLNAIEYTLAMGYGVGMPLLSSVPHSFRFAVNGAGRVYTHVHSADFPVVDLEIQKADIGTSLTKELVLEPPARITGVMIAGAGETLAFPWVQVVLDAEPTTEDRRRRTVYDRQVVLDAGEQGEGGEKRAQYPFSINVPPGFAARVEGKAKGCSTLQVSTERLTPGQTYEIEDLHLSAQRTTFLGRLVDTAGQPIANAWIRAAEDWDEDGVYTSDPALSADHEVQTDARGEFSMQTHQMDEFTIQALVQPAGEAPSPIASEVSGQAGFQFFEAKCNGPERQVLVFDPGGEGLRGVVRGPLGEAVEDFVVECRFVPEDALWGSCIVYTVSPSPYLPANVERIPWGKGSYYDSTVKFRCHSDTGQFHIRSLPPGKWSVSIGGDGYTSAVFPSVTVPDGEPIAADLEVSGSIQVEVRDFVGKPRVGAYVAAVCRDVSDPSAFIPESYIGMPTDENGQVRIEGLPVGRYDVTVKPSDMYVGWTEIVDVVAGETTELLLQPKPCGEVLLKAPWPGKSISAGPQLQGSDNGRTYVIPESWSDESLHLWDVVPGAYRLIYSSQEDKPKKLVEPIIQVKPGELTTVPIQINPGYILVTCQVLSNGVPGKRGKLFLEYAEGNQPPEEFYVGNGPRMALLPDAMPSQVVNQVDYNKTVKAVDWSRPVDGMLWEVHMTYLEVRVSLHDELGNPVIPPGALKSIASIRTEDGHAWWKGVTVDGLTRFDSVPPGKQVLHLMSPRADFPWKATKTESLVVTTDRPVHEWSVEVMPVQPVVGVITATDWPDRKPAWLTAWADADCKQKLGQARVNPNGQAGFELFGPTSGLFWLTFEGYPYKHNMNTEVFGPFAAASSGSERIRVPAHYAAQPADESNN